MFRNSPATTVTVTTCLALSSFFIAVTGCSQGCYPTSQADLMVGKPAPDINAPILDGGRFDLSAHRGENIVVLDFWASWCGPCRRVLPIVVDVTAKYEDQGVKLFAVNCGEAVDEINAYLEESELDFPVILDESGSIRNNYQVEGIPQSFIIGKDGIIQASHTGIHPGLENTLDNELQQLVSGSSLVEKGN